MGMLRRLFLGDAHLPADLRARLEAEGMLLVDEDLSGSVAPIAVCPNPSAWFCGAQTVD
jgi:hypothetical protein